MYTLAPLPVRRVALLWALVACAPPGPAAEPADTAVTPTPYEPGLDDETTPVPLTPSELEEGLAEVLVYLLRQDPLVHHEAWTQVFGENAEDGTCPVVGDHNGQDYWRDDCTTSAGARFNGWALNFRRGGWMHEEELFVRQYNWLSGHAYIVPPDGTRLQSFGDIELLIAEGPTYDMYEGFVFGDFTWDDPLAEGTWLQEEVSGEMYFQFLDHGTYQSMWYEGGATYFSGPVLAVRFEDVAMDDAEGSCALEPTGRVRLRDEAGLWVDVDFGAEGTGDTGCDGCGDASFEGAALGAVCADWTPFVTWSGWPWTD